MNVECPSCHSNNYIPDPPDKTKSYRCAVCHTSLLKAKRNGLRIFRSKGCLIPVGIVVVALVVLLALLVPNCLRAKNEAEAVVREFMQAAMLKDIDTAYQYVSSGNLSKDQISDFINDNRQFFEGYKDINVNFFSVVVGTSGTSAELRGSVIYIDEKKLQLQASLVKKGGDWKITGINLGIVP